MTPCGEEDGALPGAVGRWVFFLEVVLADSWHAGLFDDGVCLGDAGGIKARVSEKHIPIDALLFQWVLSLAGRAYYHKVHKGLKEDFSDIILLVFFVLFVVASTRHEPKQTCL
jgi:uncharacterized membrane protein YsdA (DUF1294 family)